MNGFSKRKKMHSLCCLALLLALVMGLAACGSFEKRQDAAEETTLTEQSTAEGAAQSENDSLWDAFRITMIEQDRWKDMARGLGVTLEVLFISIVAALIVGTGIFMLDYFGGRVIRKIFAWLSKIFACMPFATWMMIVLFVIFRNDSSKNFVAAVVALGVNFAFGVFGNIKGNIAGIDAGQKEAAVSMGYGKYDALRKIYLPQALPGIIGGVQGSAAVYVGMSSVAGILAVMDMQSVASAISTETMKPLFPLLIAAAIYVLLSDLLARAIGVLKDRICPPEPSEEKLKEKLMKGESR